MNWREAEIANVIGTAPLIKQHVPIRPTNCSIVEIIYHRPAVLFAKLPLVEPFCVKPIYAAFGEDQVRFRKCFVYEPHVIKHWLAPTPWFIPVVANSPDKLRSLRIAK